MGMADDDNAMSPMRQNAMADYLLSLRNRIPENTEHSISLANMLRGGLGTAAEWLDWQNKSTPDQYSPQAIMAPLGASALGATPYGSLAAGSIRREAPIVQFRRDAAAIEAALSPAGEGLTRLWRGNRPGEVGQATSFTNDLAGIALPFRKAYGGDVSYVDVPTADLARYLNTAGAAPNAEFSLPAEIAKRAMAYK